ncbi:hypothetical protein [Arenibaculum sp.]|uniref:hypothetical protein n=1 Tax=Arenibaculum sp. TaxID=2865862 RepID=UPI002E134EC7|nr:hypothetical protein [Arenibaculum sp.]
MAKLFSMPKVPQPTAAPAPSATRPAPDPAPVPAPEPPGTPDPPPQPGPEPGRADGPGGDAPPVPRLIARERGRVGTVATSWRGVLAANGGLPRRKNLLGE